ncbi:hypothetical protein GCM10017774_90380 [Lentzea cavernae]|uniref:Uncharacterized protein n=1 Tax=Lentzea cavernae TaxID=2020703 RepID=A0ABQ3MTY8_9PSEU|nr:hypothetical protein GCM10017774_90380 [Lentzea cavernae]
MCLPLPEPDPVIAYEAPRALHRACATFVLITQLTLADELRPEIAFKPGTLVEVAPVAPRGAASTSPFIFPYWMPR